MGRIVIIGGDISSTSPALVRLDVDGDDFLIHNTDFRAISTTKKIPTSTQVAHSDPKFYSDYIDKYQWIAKHLNGIYPLEEQKNEDDVYFAIEDYAFAAGGRITLLAEIAGHYKLYWYNRGAKIRMYAPTSWKKCFTGHGNADKLTIWESFKNKHNDDFPEMFSKWGLPEPMKGSGVAPTSDIIDAYGLAFTMMRELQIRRGWGYELGNFPEYELEVFRANKKAKQKDKDESYLNRPFLETKNK